MAESRIYILEKYLSSRGKNLLFVLNRDVTDDKANSAWDNLTEHGRLRSTSLEVDGIDLYNALKGYLAEKKLGYERYGEISDKHLLRLDSEVSKAQVWDFAQRITAYKKLEGRVHSDSEDKTLDRFREYLKNLASKH